MNSDVAYIVLSFMALQFRCNVTAQCTLTFPKLKNSSTFTADENDSIKLSFELSDDTECNFPEQYYIQALKVGSPDAANKCRIRVWSGKCHPSAGCTCNRKGNFTLERTVTREDNGNWEWLIKDQETDVVITNATIYFSVKYKASVQNLTLGNPQQPAAQDDQVHVANPGDRVQVKCSVEVGNPPVTARLLDRHGTELQEKKGDGKTDTVDLKYVFPNVSCDHAGLITCEAKGSENRTTTLLVRCPPMFEAKDNETYITDGDSADLNFNIRTHSTNVTCSLTRMYATEATRDCGNLNVTGTPPDLTVNVRLDNVTTHDQGTWRLKLINDVGSRHIDFHLKQAETTTSTSASTTTPNVNVNNASPRGTTESHSALKDLPYVFVGVGALAAAVSVVVCFVRRRHLEAKMRRYLATQRAGIEVPRNEDEEDQEVAAHNYNGGSEERLMMPNALPSTPPVRHGARQNRYVATPGDSRHEGGAAPHGASCKPSTSASSGLAKNEDYVDIKDINERKRQAKKERKASGMDGRQARSTAATGASNCVDVNADGLLYVQLDFSGRTTRNVMFRTLPRTDYTEVNFN